MHVSPPEFIPKSPVLGSLFLHRNATDAYPSLLDAPQQQSHRRGSLALAMVLRHLHLNPEDEILLPAYHCTAMVLPVISCQLTPVFYRIQFNTQVDLEDLEQRLTSHSKVLIAPHFFGFHQAAARLRAFCDAHRLIYLEDCAHAFFGYCDEQPIGFHGDYAIGSNWKFFPINEGGCLVSHRHSLDYPTQSASPVTELKAFVNTLEYSLQYQRLRSLRGIFSWAMRLRNHTQPVQSSPLASVPPEGWEPVATDPGFQVNEVNHRGTRWASWVTRQSSQTMIVTKRRQNYLILLRASQQWPGCRPLHPDLPEGVVPHVFPLIMDNPRQYFARLKFSGVPIIRFGEFLWEGMDPLTCPISADYSRRIFQFPCHQELSSRELQWMITTISHILHDNPATPAPFGIYP